ncbi:sporulation integral membrane protein YtvI [Priestia flexa]|jgi:sporulation integral membrane protein YtvI|uniref:Sporulation protein n=2 Tax=Priestia TaxID=2800373 RepID=A0A0V8JNU0_9BACI|nr:MULTISPECIES: sporulation integral membrane protein YtvI [Bacillaceae]AQX56002.1 sporulation integral membrane protein YtvI [Priestia flexa]KSU88723.1 sporulation protein [Priestia veravalensis]KZB92069.1 sporulation protein [Bacillus sp. VT 712]MBN8253500.1 sporulation integral membrane protein YtvI [Priestia flexa]MBN8435617.1 sporulation integral membrane protein YtvI [Priestia flexa]
MWKKRIAIIVSIIAACFLIPYSLPIVFALLTAIVLEGLIQKLQHSLKFSRIYAVLVAFLLYVVSITLIGFFIIRTIVTQVVALSKVTPSFVKELYETTIYPNIIKWKYYSNALPTEVISSIENAIESTINSLDTLLKGTVELIISFAATVPGFLLEFLIYLVALVFISLELPNIKEKVKSFLTDETKYKTKIVITQLMQAGVGFIKAQIVLSLLTFVMAYVGLWLLNVPYTALLSLLIVIVDILPILGTGSVLVPWGIFALTQGQDSLAIGLFILFGVITVVRRVVEPKVFSTNMGISPLAALISLYIGFKLLGFVGLFLGPALVILYDALRKVGVIQINFKI